MGLYVSNYHGVVMKNALRNESLLEDNKTKHPSVTPQQSINNRKRGDTKSKNTAQSKSNFIP